MWGPRRCRPQQLKSLFFRDRLPLQVSRAAASTANEVVGENDSIILEKLLNVLRRESRSFAIELGRIIRESSGPLSLILYADGITPGAILAPENKRKEVIWYTSFLEFGTKLCYEELWMTIATCKSSYAKKFPAGWSGLTRKVLRELFVQQDISGRGVRLGSCNVRINFHALLGDEEALNYMWFTKGASGTVPCAILCSVTNKPKPADVEAGVRSLSDRSDLIQDITCSDCSKIGLRTDADVWNFVDQVGAAAASSDAPKLKQLQQCYGFNYHPDALLFDHELRRHIKPATTNRNDAQHVLYANGLVGAEMALFLRSTKEEYGKYFKEVRAEMQEWHHPTAWHTPPKACFSEAREKSCHEFLKASATELLGMYKCFRKFAVDAYSNATKVASQLDSLLKLFRVCDLVTDAMRCKPGRDVEALACSMETAIADYLEAFKKAYGAENMRFKHHMLMHLPNQLRKDGLLVTCWPLERKHIVALQSLQNYCQYEDLGLGPLSRMINAQVQHTHRL